MKHVTATDDLLHHPCRDAREGTILIGVSQPPRMNQVTVGQGRALAPAGSGAARGDGAIDALVSAGFASVRGLRPGDELTALVNGKRRQLRIVGTALSPEFIFAGLAGMPDMRGFGVFWVDREALAAAYEVDELSIVTITADFADRLHSYELLAEAFALPAPAPELLSVAA